LRTAASRRILCRPGLLKCGRRCCLSVVNQRL
jgi:hypothetical protein